jgi:hypothetical protein
VLCSLAGVALIAGLWLRELSGLVVIDAVGGAVYLLLALGLLGHSRFSLFMGIVIPSAVAATLWWWPLPEVPFREQQIIGNGMIALLCAFALWRVRNIPSG